MKISACNLGKEIDDLTDVASGKYFFVYGLHAPEEAAVDKNFLTMFKYNPPFLKLRNRCYDRRISHSRNLDELEV